MGYLEYMKLYYNNDVNLFNVNSKYWFNKDYFYTFLFIIFF